jgi:FlgD Ig-like domain
MRKIVWSCLVIVLAVAGVSAGIIPDEPVETIYWRQFNSLFVVGERVVAVGTRGVVTFAITSTTEPFVEENHLRFEMTPARSKLLGDQLWVLDSTANHIHIFSLGAGLTISHLYSIQLTPDFTDFTRYGDDIIVSRKFNGLWRYHLEVGAEPQFVDTSYRGVHVTSLYTEGDNLYALDTYNGIMRYDLRGDTFGAFEGYLYSEKEGTNFTKDQDQFYLMGIAGGIIEGLFGSTGSGVTKLTPTVGIPKRVTVTNNRFIVQSERAIGWIDRNNPAVHKEWRVDIGLLKGAVYYPDNGDTWFLYPNREGGITRYSLVNGADPAEIFDRSGPIVGLAFAHGMLVAAGTQNPIDIFSLDTAGHPTLEFTVTETHPAGPVVTFGDTILAIYSKAQMLARVDVDFEKQTSIVEPSISIHTDDVLGLQYLRQIRGNRDMAIIQYPKRLDVYEWADSSHFASAKSWNTLGGIQAYAVFDSIVVFASDKHALYIHAIDSNLQKGKLYRTIETSGFDVKCIEYHAPYLQVFGSNVIYVYNLSNLNLPAYVGSVFSPRSIANFQRFDKYLFTVGLNGIQIFDVQDSIPALLGFGGRGGVQLAVNNNNLAVTDGHAIDFYLLSLFASNPPPDDTGSTPPLPPPTLPKSFAISQNYPNPFNGTTYIDYDIPRASQVLIELYNPLGQKIRTLAETTREPGRYRVMWDGRNDRGDDVATGIYYYRFIAGESRIVKKLLYLK